MGNLTPSSNANKGEVCLATAVLIFGFTFIMMRYAMFTALKPLSFNAVRFTVASLFLLVIQYVRINLWDRLRYNTSRIAIARNSEEQANFEDAHTAVGSVPAGNALNSPDYYPKLRMWSLVCGCSNFIASALVEMGLQSVNANRAGFILGMYVVFIPIVEHVVPGLNARLTTRSWVAVIFSIIGLYLLSGCLEAHVCIGGAVSQGDILIFVSMLFWVISLVCSDVASKVVDPVQLTTYNFIVAAAFSCVAAWVLESNLWRFPFLVFSQNWLVLVTVGILQACAFSMATIGQKYSSPTQTALILSLETVVCAVLSYFLLHETLTGTALIGCALMLAATVMATVDVSYIDFAYAGSTTDLLASSSQSTRNDMELQPLVVPHTPLPVV